MKREWKKRALSYLILVGVLAGALYFMQKSPVDVDTVVDLTTVRLEQGVPLAELKVSFYQDETWISSTFYAFPESRYPSGPPGNTDPVPTKLLPGTYDVVLDLTYASQTDPERKLTRKLKLEVAAAGRLEIKAGQATP